MCLIFPKKQSRRWLCTVTQCMDDRLFWQEGCSNGVCDMFSFGMERVNLGIIIPISKKTCGKMRVKSINQCGIAYRLEATRDARRYIGNLGRRVCRTPVSEGGSGRDHNHYGFSVWMAGGGVRGGTTYGATMSLVSKRLRTRSASMIHATISIARLRSCNYRYARTLMIALSLAGRDFSFDGRSWECH